MANPEWDNYRTEISEEEVAGFKAGIEAAAKLCEARCEEWASLTEFHAGLRRAAMTLAEDIRAIETPKGKLLPP